MSEPEPHPCAHIDLEQRHEWMRQDCATLASARQSREDGLVQTITQISSTAVLAIPSILVGFEVQIIEIHQKFLLGAGAIGFILALSLSMLEQSFSASAYRIQEEITKRFYLLESDIDSDTRSVNLVNNTRSLACISFALAVLLSSAGVVSLLENFNGKPATTSSTTASAAAASTTSPAAPQLRRWRDSEVCSVSNNSTAATQKVADTRGCKD
ncbi:hypothetical protein [Blastomonas sp. SL216]|uniref:hypothetical protein n=1 Tax=Blastomonas sp. SL216 TaxID=2995169 RepID=UPI002377C9E3|nr:hypothetical protein OU999_11755 [Blastomonas sp. SL216]